MGRHYDGAAGLPQKYKVSAKQPIDIREIVDTFDDLLDNRTTFYNSAYQGMRVLVLDESCVYEMVADTFSKLPSDWKRLTIETITTKEALQRAKDNLVNGALIYVANDIYEGEVYEFEEVFNSSVYIDTEQELGDISNAKIGYFSGPKKFYHYIFDKPYYKVTDDYLTKAFIAPDTDPIFIASDGSKYKYTSGYGDLEPYVDAMPSMVKKGLYFCQNINGEGKLTLAGGGGEDIYTPNASDEAQVDLQGVKAENLKGKTFSEVLDVLLFPEYGSEAGALPVLAISNPNATLEVGTTIDNASYTISQNGSSYRYIKDGTAYKQGAYTHTTPVVTTQKSEKATFGTSTRSTSETSYVITGPSADKLSEGKYLYKSKGTPSSIEPLLVGSSTITLASTSSTITGVYKGGKNGSKSDGVCVKADGQLSSSVGGTYSGTLSFNLLTDTSSTTDHAFSTLGTKSVELYIPSGVTYTVKLTATKFNAGNGKFEEDSDLTKLLDALKPTTSGKTFTDASGASYEVTSYSFNPSSITTVGKFIVSMLITKK